MSDLERIVKMAHDMVAAQEEVKRKEEELKSAKAHHSRLEREDLPGAMQELGLSELKLEDGTTLSIKEEVEARITDATRAGALQWLIDHNFGGLIKTAVSVSFGRGDRQEAQRVAEELAEYYSGVEVKEDVHHSTLKAFVREQLTGGAAVPMDLFNVFPYEKATLKKGERK